MKIGRAIRLILRAGNIVIIAYSIVVFFSEADVLKYLLFMVLALIAGTALYIDLAIIGKPQKSYVKKPPYIPPYDFLRCNVVGVSFKNGRKYRQ